MDRYQVKKADNYGKWNSCERKIRYKNETAAQRAIKSIKKKGVVFVNARPKVYKCEHCGGYHLAHRRTKRKGGKTGAKRRLN